MLAYRLHILLFLTFVRDADAELTVKAAEGENVVLSCSTKPGTSVSWQYRSQLTEGDRYMCIAGNVMPDYKAKLTLTGNSNSDYTLTINSVTINDSGLYTCTEDDGLGQKTSIRLDVHEKENVIIQLFEEKPIGEPRSNHSVQITVQWVVIVFLLVAVMTSVIVNIVVLRKSCVAQNERRKENHELDRLNSPEKVPTIGRPARVKLQKKLINFAISGVARVDQQLIVLRRRLTNHQLQFYSATDFKLLHVMSVRGLVVDKWYNDMVAYVETRCLYISDHTNKCIRRVQVPEVASPDGYKQIASWPVNNAPRSLSLTTDHNLLVTFRDALKLQELNSTDGKGKEEISLQDNMRKPWHAIKLSSDDYVVSYGLRYRGYFNVSIVSKDGSITQTYSRETSTLNEPYHLAVYNRDIYVTDYRNNSLLILNEQMKCVGHLKSNELRKPYRLCVDNKTRQLYIGQWNGTLTCAKLEPVDEQNNTSTEGVLV